MRVAERTCNSLYLLVDFQRLARRFHKKARQLKRKLLALRLTLDEWMIPLFEETINEMP